MAKDENSKTDGPLYKGNQGGLSLTVWDENVVIEKRAPEKDKKGNVTGWASKGKVYLNKKELAFVLAEGQVAYGVVKNPAKKDFKKKDEDGDE